MSSRIILGAAGLYLACDLITRFKRLHIDRKPMTHYISAIDAQSSEMRGKERNLTMIDYISDCHA